GPAPPAHHRRRIDIEGRQDALVRGALDGGGPLANFAFNLRLIHGTAAVSAALRPLHTGHHLGHRFRKGRPVIRNRDHDGHPRASSRLQIRTSDGTGSALIPLLPAAHRGKPTQMLTIRSTLFAAARYSLEYAHEPPAIGPADGNVPAPVDRCTDVGVLKRRCSPRATGPGVQASERLGRGRGGHIRAAWLVAIGS